MKKIDDEQYRKGAEHFGSGGSLRQVVERILANDKPFDRERDAKDMSFALGFADAALDCLRGQINPS